MKKKEIEFIAVSVFISLLSYIYIYYFQTTLYYKRITQYSFIFDKLYEYIAIPTFYYFITAFITFVILNLFNINISEILQRILKLIISLSLILYFIIVVIRLIGIITIPNVDFFSIYSVLFSVLGCIFAFASLKNKRLERKV